MPSCANGGRQLSLKSAKGVNGPSARGAPSLRPAASRPALGARPDHRLRPTLCSRMSVGGGGAALSCAAPFWFETVIHGAYKGSLVDFFLFLFFFSFLSSWHELVKKKKKLFASLIPFTCEVTCTWTFYVGIAAAAVSFPGPCVRPALVLRPGWAPRGSHPLRGLQKPWVFGNLVYVCSYFPFRCHHFNFYIFPLSLSSLKVCLSY